MLLNVALVTETLSSLIDKHIKSSPEADSVTGFNVSILPPDKLTGDKTIGLYLYYIAENPHYKNLPPPSPDEPPIRFTPMGLNLHYQLTAHSDLTENTGPKTEQTLVGMAVKALRDYPVIDDETNINGVLVFPTEVRNKDNRFRITLQPLQHNEAMTYWQAGAQALRLAAYYQVAVVLLEPEHVKSRAGRVLRYGVFTFVRGSPHLDGSKNTVTFTVLNEASPRTAELQPAEVPVTGQISFFGSDLAGDRTSLLVRSNLWSEAIEVEADWGVVASENEVLATVQPTAGSAVVLPGVYSAVVKVTERRQMPDNTVREFSRTSNATPFMITPLITAIFPPDAAQIVRVQGGVFPVLAGLVEKSVELFVGPERIPRNGGAVLDPGKFEIIDANNLRFRYPIAGLNAGDVVPFRLVINGAESAPNWVTVP